jgi:hypothetical protein
MWKISRNACETSFQGCRRKEKASIKRKPRKGDEPLKHIGENKHY